MGGAATKEARAQNVANAAASHYNEYGRATCVNMEEINTPPSSPLLKRLIHDSPLDVESLAGDDSPPQSLDRPSPESSRLKSLRVSPMNTPRRTTASGEVTEQPLRRGEPRFGPQETFGTGNDGSNQPRSPVMTTATISGAGNRSRGACISREGAKGGSSSSGEDSTSGNISGRHRDNESSRGGGAELMAGRQRSAFVAPAPMAVFTHASQPSSLRR